MTDDPTAAELRAAGAGAAYVDTDEVAARRSSRQRGLYKVEWDKTRKPIKPILPVPPGYEDNHGQSLWVTSVLNLDQSHPVVSAVHQGLSGSLGHIVLQRLDAPEIRFEPASKISTAQKMADELVWQLLPTDGEPYPWTNNQAVTIARVVRLLCGAEKGSTTTQETEHIVSTYLDAAIRQEGYTHQTSAQRAEMAVLLRSDDGQRHYGMDLDTGETMIRVGDLQRIAREIIGTGVAYGWLDARMEALGWSRARLEGHRLPNGNQNGRGEHVKADVYRGFVGSDG